MEADSAARHDSFAAAFGKVLKEKRLQLGKSQEEFAFHCGFDRTYISGIERGVRNPTLQVAQRLATGLGQQLSGLIQEAEALLKGGSNAL